MVGLAVPTAAVATKYEGRSDVDLSCLCLCIAIRLNKFNKQLHDDRLCGCHDIQECLAECAKLQEKLDEGWRMHREQNCSSCD